jgi:hypothetical protein
VSLVISIFGNKQALKVTRCKRKSIETHGEVNPWVQTQHGHRHEEGEGHDRQGRGHKLTGLGVQQIGDEARNIVTQGQGVKWTWTNWNRERDIDGPEQGVGNRLEREGGQGHR